MPAVDTSEARAAATGGGRVPALDGFRGYAILGVVAIHLLGVSGVLAATAGTGTGVALWAAFSNSIDAFFIISGFVLFLPAVRRGGELGGKARFWIGRAARLFPAYWLVLAIGALLPLLGPRWAGGVTPSAADIATHLAILQMPMALLDGTFRIGFGTNGPLWALSIIAGFYLVLPFIAGRYYRHPLLGLAAAAAVTIAWKQAVDWAPWIFESLSTRPPQAVAGVAVDQFPGWAFSFGLGMTSAWAYERLTATVAPGRLGRYAGLALLVAVPIYPFAAYLYARVALTSGGNIGPIARQDTFASMLQTTMRGAIILAVACAPLWLQRPFANRITDRLAELSYGVYLVHWLLVMYLFTFAGLPTDGTALAFLAWVAAVVPASLLFAAASRRWLELPVQSWVRRRLNAPPRPDRPISAEASAPP
ncbi:MAG: acyltransferase [Actinomycetes bacterium]|nr:MAG: acyltransferase [Actinomycetes bacterium]